MRRLSSPRLWSGLLLAVLVLAIGLDLANRWTMARVRSQAPPAGPVDRQLPENISGYAANGSAVDLAQFSCAVVRYSSEACGFCRKDAPRFVAFASALQSRGCEVFVIPPTAGAQPLEHHTPGAANLHSLPFVTLSFVEFTEFQLTPTTLMLSGGRLVWWHNGMLRQDSAARALTALATGRQAGGRADYGRAAAPSQAPTDSAAALGRLLASAPQLEEALALDAGERRRLEEHIDSLDRRGALLPPVAADSRRSRLRDLHLRRAAHALWLELHREVPWSLTAYAPPALRSLLGYEGLETASVFQLRLLEDLDVARRQQTWLRQTRAETVSEALAWVRGNLVHRSERDALPSSLAESLAGGRWGSCHNTADLLATMLTALNIPTHTAVYASEVRGLGGHRYVDFPADELFLPHADDPYDRSLLNVPCARLTLSGDERSAFLRLVREHPEEAGRASLRRSLALLEQYPIREYMKAACIGPAAMRDSVFGFYNCSGTGCDPARNHAAEVDSAVQHARPAVLKAAREAGVCEQTY